MLCRVWWFGIKTVCRQTPDAHGKFTSPLLLKQQTHSYGKAGYENQKCNLRILPIYVTCSKKRCWINWRLKSIFYSGTEISYESIKMRYSNARSLNDKSSMLYLSKVSKQARALMWICGCNKWSKANSNVRPFRPIGANHERKYGLIARLSEE